MFQINALALALSFWVAAGFSGAKATTTIDAADRYGYAANFGWVDARGDTHNGAVIGDYICSGFMYSANVGWISLGSGLPANKIRYQNNGSTDFGVNHDGLGNLRGLAYGANIGWISFENLGAPTVDLVTGVLTGHAWSANCGWIRLSTVTANVRTVKIAAGADLDGDGMADAWELTYTASLDDFNASSDTDGDGMDDLAEYAAGTNPKDAADYLRITVFQRGLAATPTRLDMEWTSQPTRRYAIEYSSTLGPNGWSDLVVFPLLGASSSTWQDIDNQKFYRVRAFRPLTP